MARTLLLFLLLLAALGHSNLAMAFNIKPVRLVIKAENDMETVRIENPKAIPVTFASRVFEWPDSSDPRKLSPTDELLVIPPIFEIPANGEQVVRIAKRPGILRDREKTYRLVIQQFASELDENQGVSFNFSANIPIYTPPLNARGKPNWRFETDAGSGLSLILANTGNAHLRINELTLSEELRVTPLLALSRTQAVFAGEERAWPLSVALSELKGPLTVKAETNIGPIEAVVSLPQD